MINPAAALGVLFLLVACSSCVTAKPSPAVPLDGCRIATRESEGYSILCEGLFARLSQGTVRGGFRLEAILTGLLGGLGGELEQVPVQMELAGAMRDGFTLTFADDSGETVWTGAAATFVHRGASERVVICGEQLDVGPKRCPALLSWLSNREDATPPELPGPAHVDPGWPTVDGGGCEIRRKVGGVRVKCEDRELRIWTLAAPITIEELDEFGKLIGRELEQTGLGEPTRVFERCIVSGAEAPCMHVSVQAEGSRVNMFLAPGVVQGREAMVMCGFEGHRTEFPWPCVQTILLK